MSVASDAGAAPTTAYQCVEFIPTGPESLTVQVGPAGQCPSATTPAASKYKETLLQRIEGLDSAPSVCPGGPSAPGAVSAAPAAAIGGAALVAAAMAMAFA